MLAARWASESYWPAVFRRTIDEPAPPATAFAPLSEGIAKASLAGNVDAWYRQMLEIETDVYDSHPSIAERLAHLELDPERALSLAQVDGRPSAATAYLADAEAEIVAAVDGAWRDDVMELWHEQHSEAQRDRSTLEQLEARAELSSEDALRRAQLTEVFRTPDEALARFRELIDTDNDAPARFAVGRLLLAREDDEGLRWLDEAMDRDPEAVLPSCQIAYLYLRDHDRDDEAERYRIRAEEQATVFEHAAGERSGVSVDDRLEPANLPGDVVHELHEHVARHEEVAEAYLVRKRTDHLDDTHPFFVLAVVPKSTFRTAWKESDDDAEPLEDRVLRDISLPGEVMVAKVDKKSPLAQRFAQIDGARIYERG
jgi:hypothetical protein